MIQGKSHTYSVVVADDHAQFRDYLQSFFSDHEELKISGEASNGLELIEMLAQMESVPDMAIIDITMPHMGGIETTATIRDLYPEMKILILSAHREKEYVKSALAAGADGYLLKDKAANELCRAIEIIKGNKVYLSEFFLEVEDSDDTGPTN